MSITSFDQAYEELVYVNSKKGRKRLENHLLEMIINLSVLNPAAFGGKTWSLIAVKSLDAKQRLYKAAGEKKRILDSDAILIITDDSIVKEAIESSDVKVVSRTRERDIELLSMAIMYASKYYNVDAETITGDNFEGVKNAFKIGHDKDVLLLVCLGYFDDFDTAYLDGRKGVYSKRVSII
jgi:putative NAD(P)H nitroreductase